MLGCRAGNVSISLKRQSKQEQQKSSYCDAYTPRRQCEVKSFVVRLFSKSTAFRCYIYATTLPLQIKSFLAPNQETLSLGTDFKVFWRNISNISFAISFFSLFFCNRMGLCPLLPVGWAWEASKGYAEHWVHWCQIISQPRGRCSDTRGTACLLPFCFYTERRRWQMFRFNIASWLISHLTVTTINGNQYSPTLHIPTEVIWRNSSITQD